MDDYELDVEALFAMSKEDLIDLFVTEVEYSRTLQEENVELKSYINKIHHETDALGLELESTKFMELVEDEDMEEELDELGLTTEQRVQLELLIEELNKDENNE